MRKEGEIMDLVSQLRRSSDSFDKMIRLTEENAVAISSFMIKQVSFVNIFANEEGFENSIGTVIDISQILQNNGIDSAYEAYVTNILVNINNRFFDASTFFIWETVGKQVRIHQSNLLDTAFFKDGQIAGTEKVQLHLFISVFKK